MTALTPPITVEPGLDELGREHVGRPGPTLLLVPGWCGDRTVFEPLARALAAHHHVLVADLRGHGDLPHEVADFDASSQLADLVALVERRGTGRVVPVMLSHAGWWGIGLRRRLGADRVPGLVLVDWMVLGTPPGFTDALAGLQNPEAWQEVRSALFDLWTTGVTDPAVLDYVRAMGGYGFAHWRRAGREIAAAFAAEGSPLEALARLDRPCPTLHLYAQPADPGYLAAQQEASRRHAWFRVRRVSGHSHFPMLEAPDEMATTIVEFACSPD